MDKQTNHEWVKEQLGTLQPTWTADPGWGLMKMEAKRARPRPARFRWVPVAVAAAMAVATIMLPQGRALAQELWFRLLASRIDVVRLDLSDVPLETRVVSDGVEQRVATLQEAEQKAGFRPHLPAEGLSGMTVTSPISVTQTVRVAQLNAALDKAGASEARVPQEWDGMTLRAEISPMVLATYRGDVQIAQSKPMELYAPAGISLDRLAEAALRSVGLPWMEARAMGRRLASDPALLLGIPPDEAANVRQVTVRGHSGLLVEDLDEDGAPQRVSVLFSGPERMYAVSSPSAESSLRIANSIP